MLVGLNNVTFEFGSRVIVEDATWHIQPGERIGLIGYNGQGKSTLFKILTGVYTPSKGTVERGKNVTIGYLHQDLLSFSTEDSIVEVAMSAFERVKELEKELEVIVHKLETDADEKLLEEYSDKLHEMDMLDGYNIQYKTEEVLLGLGFTTDQLTKPYKTFSGGWRMRVLLAKMILQAPDVLLLDEPTNHLDLPSIEWLEKYLQKYKGSVVIVSHDKFFLNKLVNKIVDLYQQRLNFYTGDYDYYETEREIRLEQQQRAYENQQDYIRQQERFIERFRSKASKAAQAQSIIKRLDKLDRIEQTSLERPNLNISFQVDKQPGKIITTLKGVTKYFSENRIVENTDAEIDRGDKIGLIGANGKGKSTLLRIIAGSEKLDNGTSVLGHNVRESFYAQHQLESLGLEHTIMEEMQLCGSGKTDQELRGLLGCFLFSGDDVDKKIKILSGGEKARIALAKVIASKSNFLLLDEPTNHLDMVSVELLADALKKYEGTLIAVSHDRYFISRMANKIWEIQDGEIKIFDGPYQEYVEWKERMEKLNKEKEAASKPVAAAKPKEAPKQQLAPKNLSREEQKEKDRVQKQFVKLEKEISDLEKRKQQLENDMAIPEYYSNMNKFSELEKQLNDITSKIRIANEEYEKVFELLSE
ncbi:MULTISPECIES: ABC-F family ATP-binding cassette domain-containing protein [Chitinophagaceae]